MVPKIGKVNTDKVDEYVKFMSIQRPICLVHKKSKIYGQKSNIWMGG